MMGTAALIVLFWCGLAPGKDDPSPPPKPVIAVSTNLLRMAVEEIWADQAQIRDLVPPGGCPGHYDLKPDDLRGLATADVIVLHEFQKTMGDKISRSALAGKPILIVPDYGSLLAPPGHREALSFLAANLVLHAPGLQAGSAEGLASALAGVDRAEGEARELARGRLRGRPVVAAKFQADFCRYWGMKVVAVIEPGDPSARDLAVLMEAAREGAAVAVVGNEQSGRKTFEVLAERLDLPLAMLSNFPAAPEGGKLSYRDFLLDNVRRLIDVVVGE